MIRVSFPLFLYFIFLLFYVIINFYKNCIIITIFFFSWKLFLFVHVPTGFIDAPLSVVKEKKNMRRYKEFQQAHGNLLLSWKNGFVRWI